MSCRRTRQTDSLICGARQGFVLAFVGSKMLMDDLYKISIPVSLGVVRSIIGAWIVISLLELIRKAHLHCLLLTTSKARPDETD
jgi:uncharacterized membrane protein YeaQ/YmgE (transglycosylase-associated protein family)